MLLELEKLGSQLDVRLQEVLRILAVGACVAGVLLNVQPDGGAGAARARQAYDDPRSIGELHVQALVRRDAAVKVSVGEVACFGNRAI